jgi:hypothetical protein
LLLLLKLQSQMLYLQLSWCKMMKQEILKLVVPLEKVLLKGEGIEEVGDVLGQEGFTQGGILLVDPTTVGKNSSICLSLFVSIYSF